MVTSDSKSSESIPLCRETEAAVRRRLLDAKGVSVSSLVVRRIQDGVCLEGVLRFDAAEFSIEDSVLSIPGVRRVLNRMVICSETDVTNGEEPTR